MTGESDLDPVRVGIAWQDPAMLRIGKSGVSDSVIEEARRLLKKHRYIKVRLLRSTRADKISKQTILKNLCSRVGAQLVGIRGNTAVLFKPRRKKLA